MRKHPPRMKLTRCELPSAAQLHLPSRPRNRAGSSHTLLRPVQPKGAPPSDAQPLPRPSTNSDRWHTQLCPRINAQ